MQMYCSLKHQPYPISTTLISHVQNLLLRLIYKRALEGRGISNDEDPQIQGIQAKIHRAPTVELSGQAAK